MTLSEFIKGINTANDEFTIYQKQRLDIDAEIILIHTSETNRTVFVKDGIECYYLLEVFLAKEIVDQWIKSIKFVPTEKEIAQRVFEYAINDA